MTLLQPTGDDVDGNWLNQAGSNTNLFQSIDEGSASGSDADYIISPNAPVFERCRFVMADVAGGSEPFVLRYRFNNTLTTLRVRLMQGASTEIAAWTHEEEGWTTAAQTLTTAQFNLITDFTDLFVEFTATNASLDLDFTQSDTLDSRITFTRSTVATYFDEDGILQTASANVARRDHDPITGLCRGLLIEEQRTNIVLWCRDLTQSAWTKTNATAALNQTGTDGVSNSASSITATAANGTVLQSITLASSVRYQTAYVKRITGSGTIQMTMDNGSTWTTVAVTSAWSRISIPAQTLANPTVGFRIVTSGDAIAVDFVQNENGSFATSAIPTDGTAGGKPRALDAVSMTGTNFSAWYNQSQGAFVLELALEGTTGDVDGESILAIQDAAGGELHVFYRLADGTLWSETYDGGIPQATKAWGAVPLNTTMKLGKSYVVGAGGYLDCKDGGTVNIDAGTIPTVDRLLLGGTATQPSDFWVRRFTYWNTIVTDVQLQAITAL